MLRCWNRRKFCENGKILLFMDNFCQIKKIPCKILRFCRLNIPPWPDSKFCKSFTNFLIETQFEKLGWNFLKTEGEFLVKKSGFGRELGGSLVRGWLQSYRYLPPNSLQTHNFFWLKIHPLIIRPEFLEFFSLSA